MSNKDSKKLGFQKMLRILKKNSKIHKVWLGPEKRLETLILAPQDRACLLI
jgi:hypothetical protein